MRDTAQWLLHAPSWRRFWRWLLVTLMAATSWLAFVPDEPRPDTLGQWDKLEHAAAFAALSVVATLASTGQHLLKRVALPLLGYGMFIEGVQTCLPTRHGDILDLLADAGGILLGMAFAHWLRRRWPSAATLS